MYIIYYFKCMIVFNIIICIYQLYIYNNVHSINDKTVSLTALVGIIFGVTSLGVRIGYIIYYFYHTVYDCNIRI